MTDSSSCDFNVFVLVDQIGGSKIIFWFLEIVYMENERGIIIQSKVIFEILFIIQCFNFNFEWKNENMCSCIFSNNEGDDYFNESDFILNLSGVSVGVCLSLTSLINILDGIF